MAQSLDYYIKQAQQSVSPAYDIQAKELSGQIAGAAKDPYYTSLISGLEATKSRSFAGIEGRAAARGAGYGNIIQQQQARYLGEQYLPAVAEVKKVQSDYISSLRMKLADLKAQRASAATDLGFKLRSEQIGLEESARNRAASAASASDSGGLTANQLSGINTNFYKRLEQLAGSMAKAGGTGGREKVADVLGTEFAAYYDKEAVTEDVMRILTPGWESRYEEEFDFSVGQPKGNIADLHSKFF